MSDELVAVSKLHLIPFSVGGTVSVNNFPATQVVSGTVTANQGGAWSVSILNFPASQSVTQGTSPWVVSLASTTITGTVAVTQSTSPWVISGTVASTQSGAWTVSATQGTSPWVVNGGNWLTDSQLGARVSPLGIHTAAASTSVVLASDQAAIPVSVTAISLGLNGVALDRATFTEAVSFVTPTAGVVLETPLLGDVIEKSVGEVRITPKRAFHVNLRTNAGVEFGTVGNPIQTAFTGTVTVAQPISIIGKDGTTIVTPANFVPVGAPQVADANNSTTYTNSILQYVGTFTRTRSVGYTRQLTVLASDVASGLGGTFVFEYSEDGITATISETRMITDFATVRDFDLINAGEFYRVKFTPSRLVLITEHVFINTTQRKIYDGQFVRLANQQIEEANSAMGQSFAYLKGFDSVTGKSTNLRPLTPAGNIAATDSGLLTKSVLCGRYYVPVPAAIGTYPNTPTNLLGYLHVISAEFLRDVSLGRVAGHSITRVVSRNDAVAGALEDIWDNSGAHTYPAAAAVVSLVSTSVLDTVAGTGVRTVTVEYLDATYTSQTETLNMAGIVPVTTVGMAIRVQRLTSASVGTGGVAAGTISASVTALLQNTIPIGRNRSLDSFFTIPAGLTGVVTNLIASVGQTDEMEVTLFGRATGALQPFVGIDSFILYQSSAIRESYISPKISSQTDVKWQASRYGGGSGKVHVQYDVLLINNSLVA